MKRQSHRDLIDGLKEVDRLWKKLDSCIESFEHLEEIQKVNLTRLQIKLSVASFISSNTIDGEKNYDSC